MTSPRRSPSHKDSLGQQPELVWGGAEALKCSNSSLALLPLASPLVSGQTVVLLEKGLEMMLPIPGEGGLVCSAVSPQSCWPTPPCPHSLPILPVNGASREMAGVVEDSA